MSIEPLLDPRCPWAVVLVAASIATVHDLRSRRIPNRLTLPLFGAGVLFAMWSGGWHGLAEGLGAALLLAAPFLLLFAFAGGGAGDAKLMGALGPWLGLQQSVTVLASVAVAGIVLALAWAAVHGRLTETLLSPTHRAKLGALQPQAALAGPDTVNLKMPYAPAILLGLTIAAFWLDPQAGV